MVLLALAAVGFSVTSAKGQATSSAGELILGFRASGGSGNTTNYVVDLGDAAVLRDQSSVQTLALTGVGTDLSTIYGANWATRTDLFWGVVANTGNFSVVNSDPVSTLYATMAEATNGTIVTGWERNSVSTQSATTNYIAGARTGFNAGSTVFNSATISASTIARVQPTSASNSWTRYMPGGSLSFGIAFQTWDPTIEGTPGQNLDLFRMAATGDGDPAINGSLVARLVLQSTGSLLVIPGAIVGKSTLQLSAATYNAAENAGTLDVTVTRTGDTTVGASIKISTTDGTGGSAATAPSDYTAITNQTVTFAANEVSKVVPITVINRAGDQGNRSFTVTLSGADASNLLGTQTTATCTITEASLPSTVQLSATSYSVTQSATASSVLIGLTRTGGSDSLSVTVTPSALTGDFAVAGTNFDATAKTATFASNSNTTSVSITLPAQTTGNKHLQFHVTVTNVNVNDTNPTIGTPAVAAVRLLSPTPDSGAPTVALTPTTTSATTLSAATASINETANHLVTVSGTATDDKGVIDRVEIRLNGAAPINASSLTPNSSGAGFSHQITPIGGTNTVIIQSFDALGKASTPVTKTFTYVKKRSLALAIAPSIGGTVTGLKAASLTAPPYQVGSLITLTAKANAGYIFKNWTSSSTPAGLTGPATEQAVLNAVFTDALATNTLSAVPNITANFIVNPFTVGSATLTNAVTGTFNGLVIADNSSTPSNSTNGMISGLTLTSAGTFTGTLKIDGIVTTATAIAGSFDPVTGIAKFGTTRSTKLLVDRSKVNKPSYELDLHLETASGIFASPSGTEVQQIKGHLVQKYRNVIISTSNVTLDRAFYGSTNLITNATMLANKGIYNFAFPASTLTVPNTFIASDYPHGDGFGTLTITNLGVVTMSATLADGTTKVTATAPVSKTFVCPLYSQLYTGLAGSIGGNVTFASTADTDVAGSDFFWFRPWLSAQQYYPWGWPEGISVDLVGTKLLLAANPIIPGMPASANNATLSFTDGQLVLSSLFVADKDLSIIPTTNVVSNVPITDATFKLTITTASATFAGDFTHSDGTRPKFSGIILQKGANSKGFGFFQTVAPKVVDGTGETGGVSLVHK